MQETSSLCKWENFHIKKIKLTLHSTICNLPFGELLVIKWTMFLLFTFSPEEVHVFFCVYHWFIFFTPWSLVYVPKWNWNVVNNCISTICTSMWFHYILHFSSLWQVTSSTGHSSQSSDSYRWGLTQGILSRVSTSFLISRTICFEDTLQVSQLWNWNQVSKVSGFFSGGVRGEYPEGKGFISVLTKRL